MAKAPKSKATAEAPGKLVDGDAIRMLVGQEGPSISRVRGQELTVGEDLGADEANRLIDADFAEKA